MNSIRRGQYLKDNAALGVVQEAARVSLSEGFTLSHHGREGMSAITNLPDIGALGGKRFRRRVPLRGVIGPLGDRSKLALLAAC